MTLLTKEIPAIIAGVSQQASSKRSDGHVTDAINMNLDAVSGATSRVGTIAVPENSPVPIDEGVVPSLIHEIDRSTGEKYNVIINQHDAAGDPLDDAEILVLDAEDGFSYTVNIDDEANWYIDPQVARSKLSAVTLYDTTIISNPDVTTAMLPIGDVGIDDRALITVHTLPDKFAPKSSTSPTLKDDMVLRVSDNSIHDLELDSDGSNYIEYKQSIDITQGEVWSVRGPDSDHLYGPQQDLRGSAAIVLEDLMSEYRNGLIYVLNHRGYEVGRGTGVLTEVPVHMNDPIKTMTAGSAGRVNVPIADWPESVANGYSGGVLHTQTPAGFLADVSSVSLTTGLHNDASVIGVNSHMGVMELLYTNPADLNPKTLKFQAVFHNTSSTTEGSNAYWDVRDIYIKFTHAISQDDDGTTYDHFRSATTDPNTFKSFLAAVPGLQYWSTTIFAPYNIIGRYTTTPTASTYHLENELIEITNLQNTGSWTETDHATNHPYKYWHIRPVLGDSSWDDTPDLIWYDTYIDELDDYIGNGFGPYETPTYRRVVTNTASTDMTTSLVVSPPDHTYLTTLQEGGYLTEYQGRSDLFPDTGYNHPAWDWSPHGTDQIYGIMTPKLYDSYNKASGTTGVFDHPNYAPLDADKDSNFSFDGLTPSEVTVITESHGPRSIADLPYHAPDGFLTRIQGDEEADGDEYYLKYFDAGKAWVESRARNESHTLNAATMPHILRRVEDAGEPRGIRFIFQAAGPVKNAALNALFPNPETSQWKERLVGDAKNSPPPSFIGSGISNVFLFKSRLCAVSRSNVVLTETSEPFNFFPTSLQTSVDADPIDLEVTQTGGSVVNIFAGVPLENGVMLFDRERQFLLKAAEGQSFNAKTASIDHISSYPMTENITPLFVGNRILWVSTQGSTTRVWEFYPSSAGARFEEITQHVPTYIPAGVSDLLGSENESMLAIRTDGDASSLFIYKYVYTANGQKLQQSWSRWEFDGDILHARFIKGILYLLIMREDGYNCEYLDLNSYRDFTLTGLGGVVGDPFGVAQQAGISLRDSSPVMLTASLFTSSILDKKDPSFDYTGDFILFTKKAGSFIYGIFRMRVDGSDVTQITAPTTGTGDTRPVYSPDETQIAFVRDGEVHIMDADGSNIVNISSGVDTDHPSWNPAGTKLAYQLVGGGHTTIYVADTSAPYAKVELVDSGAASIAPGSTNATQPAWSHDGLTIAFTSTSDAAGDPVAGQVIKGLAVNATTGVATSTPVLYNNSYNDGFYNYHPSWSVSDDLVFYSSDRSGGTGYDIYAQSIFSGAREGYEYVIVMDVGDQSNVSASNVPDEPIKLVYEGEGDDYHNSEIILRDGATYTALDEGSLRVCLDHKIMFDQSAGDLTYDAGTDLTTLKLDGGATAWTTPLGPPGVYTGPFVALAGPGTETPGYLLVLTIVDDFTATVPGMWHAYPISPLTPGFVFVGLPYEQSLTLSRFFLRSNSRRLVEQTNNEDGRTQLKTLSVSYDNTPSLVLTTTFTEGWETSGTVEHSQSYIASSLNCSEATFDINGRNTTTELKISGATHDSSGELVHGNYETNITGLRYEVQYHARARRFSR